MTPWLAGVAALPAAATAVFLVPGAASVYGLPQWGILACAAAAAALVVARHPLPCPRRARRLLGSATTLALAMVLVPLAGTPFRAAHLGGSLRLLAGLLCFSGTLLWTSGSERAARCRAGLTLLVAAGAGLAVVAVVQALGGVLAAAGSPGRGGQRRWTRIGLVLAAVLGLLQGGCLLAGDGLWTLGTGALARGDRAAAEAGWHGLHDRFPALVTPRYELGRLAAEAGRGEEAAAWFGSLLALPLRAPGERALRRAALRRLEESRRSGP
ncbi:MAG: hypothetical protein AB1505_11805 [Candidatus Latescibacterota bacterium]